MLPTPKLIDFFPVQFLPAPQRRGHPWHKWVDLVPAGFRANTTVAYDPVFTVCPPRVGEDFTFDAVLANTTHTATVRNKI